MSVIIQCYEPLSLDINCVEGDSTFYCFASVANAKLFKLYCCGIAVRIDP